MKTKTEIENVINEIETFNFYNRLEMLQSKENWLRILNNAVENYDKLETKEYNEINIVFVMHYMKCSNAMFYTEIGKSFGKIVEVLKKIVDKQYPENINCNSITNIDVDKDGTRPDENIIKPL